MPTKELFMNLLGLSSLLTIILLAIVYTLGVVLTLPHW